MQRMTISIDDDIAQDFDELCRKRGYKNRSEAFRDLVRRELAQKEMQHEDGPCMAVVSFGFDHHVRSLPGRLTSHQHSHHESVVATMHVHATQEKCVEIVVVKGNYSTVVPLAEGMIAETGIEEGAVHYISMDPESAHTHDHEHDHEHSHAHGHAHGHEHVHAHVHEHTNSPKTKAKATKATKSRRSV